MRSLAEANMGENKATLRASSLRPNHPRLHPRGWPPQPSRCRHRRRSACSTTSISGSINSASPPFFHELLKLLVQDAALESAWIWRWRKTDQPAAGAVQAAAFSNGDVLLATGNCGNARRSVQPVSIRKLARPLGFPLPADRRRRASRFRRSHVVAGREVMNTQVMREELPVAGDSLP